MIEGMFDSGSLPVLERLVQFTGARQTALANDIANVSTPYYKPRDLNVKEFQAELRRAIEQRREQGGELRLEGHEAAYVWRRRAEGSAGGDE